MPSFLVYGLTFTVIGPLRGGFSEHLPRVAIHITPLEAKRLVELNKLYQIMSDNYESTRKNKGRWCPLRN